MPFKTLLNHYIIYNHWANERLMGWLKQLDEGLLYAEIKSSFSSIDLTLQHMTNAQNFWYAVITKEDVSKLDETIKVKSVASNMEQLINGSQRIIATFNEFNESELLETVTSPVMTQCRFDFILHMINHNSYHRGQIVTIARILGIKENIPETEYEAFLWFEDQNNKFDK